jgi:opacity protein-like surface antigen
MKALDPRLWETRIGDGSNILEGKMKKIMVAFTALFTLVSTSQPCFAESFKIGGCVNYYSVADSLFKDVYGKGNLMFGGALSYEPIRMLELRAEAHFFKQKGEMTISKEEITLTMRPIILGARIRFVEINRLSPYIGIGVDFYSYKEKIPDRFDDVSEHTTGFHVEGGFYVDAIHSLYLDVNIRYTKADTKPFDETVKLGGIRAGIGFGIQF